MKLGSLVSKLTCAVLVSASVTAHAGTWPVAADVPQSCAKAHEEYLAENFGGAAASIAACMESDDLDAVVEKNARGLLQAIYAENDGMVPADFRLPEGLSKLRLSHRRNEDRKRVFYVLEFLGQVTGNQKVEELKLVRYPDQVILDKRSGSNEWNEENGRFYLKVTRDLPWEEGLYGVTIKLEGGTSTTQWVPVVDWASDRTPEILTPTPNESVHTPNPTVAWRPFSTGDRGYDYRGVSVRIVQSDAPDYAWNEIWKLNLDLPAGTSYVVGREPRGEGVTELPKGRHLVVVTYQENRRYGSLVISKASSSRHPFWVR